MQFADLLLEWNKKINLISRRDEENFWTCHILHSLSVLFKVDIPPGVEVLDLGTGGGLPGVPLKIARPDLALTLLDSTQKKINVARVVVNALGLTSVEIVWGRAEVLGKQEDYRHRYAIVVARAVAPLKDLVRWSLPFLKQERAVSSGDNTRRADARRPIAGPTLVAFKGGDIEGEIRQIRNNPLVENISVIDLTLKGSTQLEERGKKIILVEFAAAGQKQKAK